MATSAASLYVTNPTLVNLTKLAASAGVAEFPVKTRVNLNNGKVAVYVIAGGVITVSASVGNFDADGTASSSAGPYISMADTTAAAGNYLWVRTSADEVLP